MFLRREKIVGAPAGASVPIPAAAPRAGGTPSAAPPPRKWPLTRIVKIAGAVGTLALGVAAVMSGDGYISSADAVVSARVVFLRAPIEGVLTGQAGGIGSPVSAGQIIAHVENARVDDQRLIDLQQEVLHLRAEAAAAATERDTLFALRRELLHRADSHSAATRARLQHMVEEAEYGAAAMGERQGQTQRDLGRKTTLRRTGDAAAAEVERLRAETAARQHELAAQVSRTNALRAQDAALARGIYIDNGGSDVVYSAQRSDEVVIRIAEINRRVAELAASLDEANSRLRAEQHQDALRREAEIVAPHSGLVWKLGVGDGERVGVGDIVAEVVDCNSPVLLVAVPQVHFAQIAIGSTARFRLAGDAAERTGTVIAVSGAGPVESDPHLAAVPYEHDAGTALVQVQLTPASDRTAACPVGRTARVLLPSADGGLLTRIRRLLS